MLVRCACCGWDGHVWDYQRWTKEGSKYPAVWICDICIIDLTIV